MYENPFTQKNLDKQWESAKCLLIGEFGEEGFEEMCQRAGDVVSYYHDKPWRLDTGLAEIEDVMGSQSLLKLFHIHDGTSFSHENGTVKRHEAPLREEFTFTSLPSLLGQVDRYFRNLLVNFTDEKNQISSNSFTPDVFYQMRINLAQEGVVPDTCLLSADLWEKMQAFPHFKDWFDKFYGPTKTGFLGCFLGINLWTDKNREEEAKYLKPGEAIMVSSPKSLGVCTTPEVILEDGMLRVKLGAKVIGHPRCVSWYQPV